MQQFLYFNFQIIRLIKHDLRINAGPKHILEALNIDAYPVFQSSRDLILVVEKFGANIPKALTSPTKKKEVSFLFKYMHIVHGKFIYLKFKYF